MKMKADKFEIRDGGNRSPWLIAVSNGLVFDKTGQPIQVVNGKIRPLAMSA